MRDPLEGVSTSGTITTGADINRVSAPFRPVLDAAITAVSRRDEMAALYVYGSVATGEAVAGRSDVDLLTVDLDAVYARSIAAELSSRFVDVCRAVEVAAASAADLTGDHDDAYGGRVFLRHYCVLLSGPDHDRSTHDFPADARAARGFNGDIADLERGWGEVIDTAEPSALGRRIARKSLLAVAGLVSVADGIWTTDRDTAASRWADLEPDLADGLALLRAWSNGTVQPGRDDVQNALAGIVARIVEQFADRIGLWVAD